MTEISGKANRSAKSSVERPAITAGGSLPVPLTSLVGRESEIKGICRLLEQGVRLVTLTGAPGIGKTRLGIAVAGKLSERFAGGVYFVSLAPVTDAQQVLASVAHALGIRITGEHSPAQILKNNLAGIQLLLVLDNFEHVISAAGVVAELLLALPELTVLATSRELLRISGEHDYPVPPLPFPPVLAHPGSLKALVSPTVERMVQYQSVQLFRQRAAAHAPSFALTEENALVVAGICSRLDGLPLAIELAAARIRHLPPQAILERLQGGLQLLRGGARDLPPRQRTLWATIDWSFELLDDDEKRLFCQMAVFRGGATLEAIEAVSGSATVLETVSSLVDKSLLQRQESSESIPRFSMLEMIREYAWERLAGRGEEPQAYGEIRRRHAELYLGLAEAAEPHLIKAAQVQWLARLENERANLHAAFHWARNHGEAEIALRLAVALYRFWFLHGPLGDGVIWLEQALQDGAGAPLLRMKAVDGLADLLCRMGEYERAAELYAELLTWAREADDEWWIAKALGCLGEVAVHHGQGQQALSLFEETVAISRRVGDEYRLCIHLNYLAEAMRMLGNYERAVSLYEESVALARKLKERRLLSTLWHNLGQVAHRQGKLQESSAFYDETLNTAQELGDPWMVACALGGLAGLAASAGHVEGVRTAARLSGAMEAILEAAGARLDPLDLRDYEANVSAVREALGEEAWEAAWTEGYAVTLEEAVELGRSVVGAHWWQSSLQQDSNESVEPLTRREQEVAALVTAGLANREIADELVLSVRTVEGHVSNLLAKLGFQSRSQIAAWGVRAGLLDSGARHF